MTAEVAPYKPPPPAQNLDGDVRYAKLLADANLVPRQYQGQPGNVLYAIGFGRMLGIHPIAAITGVNIIEGKPTASAALISALVRRAGHRLRVSSDVDENGLPTATAWIVRRDDPDFTYSSTWTLQRAERAGLCKVVNGKAVARSKQGNPLPWETYTEALLKARAVSEVARDACEEALSGIHYTAEELGADVDEEGNPKDALSVQPAVDAVSTPVDEVVEDAVIVPHEPAQPAERQGTRRSKEDTFAVSDLRQRIIDAPQSEVEALFYEAEEKGVLDETTLGAQPNAEGEYLPVTTIRGLLTQRQMEAPAAEAAEK